MLQAILEYVSLEMVLLVAFLLALVLHWRATLYKVYLYSQSLLYILFSADARGKLPYDPEASLATFLANGGKVDRVRLIFVRHGESTWNDTFNRSKNPIYFIPRLVVASLHEIWLLVTGQRDSWFYDSPLSVLGLHQAQELRQFIGNFNAKDADNDRTIENVQALKGENSLIVTSPLRRALSTISVALWDRLQKNPEEKMVMHSALQEISRNPDTLAITPPRTNPICSWIDQRLSNHGKGFGQGLLSKLPHSVGGGKFSPELATVRLDDAYALRFDSHLHAGNKPVLGHGVARLQTFAHFAFSQQSARADKETFTVVVSGHSLWFRSFFRSFLPKGSTHPAKTEKIVNGGALAFDLQRGVLPDGQKYFFLIDEQSIQTVYGGLSVPKKKYSAAAGKKSH